MFLAHFVIIASSRSSEDCLLPRGRPDDDKVVQATGCQEGVIRRPLHIHHIVAVAAAFLLKRLLLLGGLPLYSSYCIGVLKGVCVKESREQ